MQSSYYPELNRLRGLAIFLVVLGHSIIRYPIDILSMPAYLALYNYIYSFHMPLFFVISGIYYGFSSVKSYKNFIMKKAQRLILCYFLFSLVALASKLLLSSLVNRKVGGLWEGLHAIVFQGGSYWFLYVLFIIFLIFPAIEILIKKSKLWLVGSLIGALYFFDIYPKIFALRLVGYHLIFFFVGYSLAAHYERFKKATLRFQFPLLLISMTLLAITGHSDIHQSKLAAFIIPFFGILTSYVIINMVKFNPINSLLNTFGVYSLQIYLLEPLILVISRYVLVNHLNISDPITLIVLIVILKLCISILAASLILQRFALTRLLCGFSNKRIDNLIRVPAS